MKRNTNININRIISLVRRRRRDPFVKLILLLIFTNIAYFSQFIFMDVSIALLVNDNIMVTIPSIRESELESRPSPLRLQRSSPIKNYEGDSAVDDKILVSIEKSQYRNHTTNTVNSPSKKDGYGPSETGSTANCTAYDTIANNVTLLQLQKQYQKSHNDSDTIIASCRQIHYRVPLASFQSVPSIIFGVLSIANGEGPTRRQSIRETWGYNRRGVFFLVAGPWEELREEYDRYGDLLWIDEEEVYDGERSVLTWKTLTFASVVHRIMGNINSQHARLNRDGSGGGVVAGGYSHSFKTDDDTYVNVENLYRSLYSASRPHVDYWGWCQEKKYPPNRSDGKWSVTYQIYPEPVFPLYCQGAGFALSRNFLDCAVGDKHVAHSRYMPFEDVAVGMLAERCGITPTQVPKRSMIRLYRTKTKQERNYVRLHLGKVGRHRIPGADVWGRVLQHRIYDVEDMEENHRTALDPAFIPPKRLEWMRKVALKREEEDLARKRAGEKNEGEIGNRTDYGIEGDEKEGNVNNTSIREALGPTSSRTLPTIPQPE